jgi:F-type H+-transporting ATPase subunit alpha
VAEQVVVIWSVTNGYVDSIPVDQVSRFNDELVESLRAEGSILKAIEETKDLSDETVETLRKHLDTFKDSFFVDEGKDAAGTAA